LPEVIELNSFTETPLQLLEAVGVVNVGVASHVIVALGPGDPIVTCPDAIVAKKVRSAKQYNFKGLQFFINTLFNERNFAGYFL